MKKPAKDLQPGDVIPPPSHERGWLWRDGIKRMMTVESVSEGRVDKNGLWLNVKTTSTFNSPCDTTKPLGGMTFAMRPETMVSVA